MKKALNVIIARKGSKGLPSKCMLDVQGKSVLEHVIIWSTGLQFKDIEITTCVSTDIDDISEICRKHDAIHVERDPFLATDKVRVEDVILDAVSKTVPDADYISLLYGNVPIRYPELFNGPLEFLEDNPETDGILTFQNVEKFNPSWMTELISEGHLPDSWVESAFRRQDLKQYMIHDGHTILFRGAYFKQFMLNGHRTGKMYEQFGMKLYPWLHDLLVIDIDTARDYYLVKALFDGGYVKSL
ncbi:MAG: hypothetical protein JXR95_15465 [Deltaproteobacteria bacterium]|nr:hypothetical protein [Deltaproteobacteria bacterium]